jgi:hypothetical protein
MPKVRPPLQGQRAAVESRENAMEGHERRGSLFCRVSGGSGALETNTGTSNED